MFSSSLIFLKKDHKTQWYLISAVPKSQRCIILSIYGTPCLRLGIPKSQILSTGTETQILPVPHTQQPVIYTSPDILAPSPAAPLLGSPGVWDWTCCCCSPRRSTWSATPVKLLLKRVTLGWVVPGMCGVAGRRARRIASESEGVGEELWEATPIPGRRRAASLMRPSGIGDTGPE